jgi:hypothetical protein
MSLRSLRHIRTNQFKLEKLFNDTTGLAISILVMLAVGLYSLSLGQDLNWDLRNYHLYGPFAFLQNRIETDLAPAGMQSYFSPLLDIAYFKMVIFFGPKTVGFLLGFIQGLNFLLIYKIASKLLTLYRHNHLYSLLLALAGVLSVGFQAEIGTVMNDSLVALFPLTSLWMILTAISLLDETDLRPVYRLLGAAGLVAGIGIGLKLVSAIYALPLCLSLLILPVHWFGRFKLALLFGVSVLVGLFVTGGYWMYEVWRLFGNPLFPQYNHIFHGELAIFESIRDIRFLPKTFFDKLFYPIIFTLNPQRAAELVYAQYSWLVAYIAVFGLFAARVWFYLKSDAIRRPWNLETSYLLVFFCISYFLWLNTFGIYRYLIVIELLIPLLLFVIITYVFKARKSYIAALVFIVILTAVNLPGAPSWGRSPWSDTLYSIEPSELDTGSEPAIVYLAGMPLAWIIPALDINTPFIQIVPNFPVSEAYWQRAKMLAANRVGRRFVVFMSYSEQEVNRAAQAMVTLGISIDESSCDFIVAYLGTAKSEHRFCEIRKTESDQ